ncbi:MAG TPA: hypothetical protein VEK57_17355 [Thermoanaerobaculia bacterium]|nr:hypothetical protein [Thermoanaerobaculia bacterium]
MLKRIYTIGHSTRGMKEFVQANRKTDREASGGPARPAALVAIG